MLKLAEVLRINNSMEEAQETLLAALADFEAQNDQAGIAEACLLLAQTNSLREQMQEAEQWLQRVWDKQAEHLEPHQLVKAHQTAARIARHQQQYRQAESELEKAIQIARANNLTHPLGTSQFERGNMLADQGQHARAIAHFEKTLKLFDTTKSPVYQALCHNNMAYNYGRMKNYTAAHPHLEAGLALAEQYALGVALQYLYSTRGEIELATNQLDAAEADFKRALTEAEARKNIVQAANIRTNQAQLAQARQHCHAKGVRADRRCRPQSP